MQHQVERRLKLRMLRAMSAIEEHASLLKASRALCLTQPALTKTLHEVESIVGGRVFERHSRGMTPTELGVVVCASARRILAEVSRLGHDVARFHGEESKQVAIGAMPPAAVGVIPGVLAKLRTDAPHIHVQMTQGRMEDLIPLLNEGEIEMIMGRIYPAAGPDDFAREILYDEPIAILARADHPVFDNASITAEALSRYKFVLPLMSERVEQEVQTALASVGLTDTVEVRSSSLPFLRELLHTSDYLILSPPMTMGGDLARGTLKIVPFKIPGPPRPAGLLLRKDRPLSPASRALFEKMREYFDAA